jgi:hypothetical protein
MEAKADDGNRRTLLMVAMTITLFCIICSSMSLIAAILARREEAARAAQLPAGQPDELALAVITETPLSEAPVDAEVLPATASPLPAETPLLEATATPAVLQGKGDEKVDLMKKSTWSEEMSLRSPMSPIPGPAISLLRTTTLRASVLTCWSIRPGATMGLCQLTSWLANTRSNLE